MPAVESTAGIYSIRPIKTLNRTQLPTIEYLIFNRTPFKKSQIKDSMHRNRSIEYLIWLDFKDFVFFEK